MTSSTYRDIMSIARAMIDESTLSKRREAGRQLEQKLSSARVRQQLALEAGDNRQEALAEMWRFIVPNAITAVQKVIHSKSKLTRADILVCFSIIKCCDIPDEAMTQEEVLYKGFFRLTRKEMRMVLNFCLTSLCEDEEALNIAEMDLLDMLAYIVASRGYVSYFKSQHEIQLVLEEVAKRISNQDLAHSVREKSAEIFCNLCKTTNDLGMEMTLVMPGSVKMVADWSANTYQNMQQNNGSRTFAELSPLIDGLTTMMRFDPVQAIAPITRHGRAVLKLGKACYRRVVDRGQRHVLNQFFLCHLIVAQTAGELTGMLPGDLGDLGEASLTPKLVKELLHLAMERNGELSAGSISGSRGVDLEAISFDEIQRTQLELIARLFSCSQRIALCQLEQQQMGDETHLLIQMIADIPKPGCLPPLDVGKERFAASAEDVVARAPFMRLIMRPLYEAASTTMTKRPGQAIGVEKDQNRLPIFTAFATLLDDSKESPLIDSTAVRASLQILAACAEAFPMGSCWASRSQSCWFEIPGNNDGHNYDHRRHIHSCDTKDLATIVAIVGNVLDAHGDHSGEVEVQKWSLRCLIRLAKSTSCHLLDGQSSNPVLIAKVWQSVWSIIFRSDLRYSAYTANTKQDSVAELVLSTLSAMVKHRCTDPSTRWSQDVRRRRSTFLYRSQTDIWNLPVFSMVGESSSLASLSLIVDILHNVGLSEGSDSICQGLQYKGFQMKWLPDKSRRHRLINFCLSKTIGEADNSMLGAAACTLAELAHGHESSWSKNFGFICGDSSILELSGSNHSKGGEQNLFGSLWGKSRSLIEDKGIDHLRQDAVSACLSRLESNLSDYEKEISSANVLAGSLSGTIFDELKDVLNLPSEFLHSKSDIEEDDNAVEVALVRLKIDFTVFLSRNKGPLLTAAFELLTPRLVGLLKMVTTHTERSNFLSESLRIIDFVVTVTSSEGLELPDSVVDQSQELAEELEKCLETYLTRGASEEREQQEDLAPAPDLDADDIEDRLMGDGSPSSSRKRPRAETPASRRKRSRKKLEISGAVMRGALTMARLLFALKPNLPTVRFIAETLLRVDLDRPLTFYDSSLGIDPILCASLTELFSPLLRSREYGANSGAALLCRLIRLVRCAPPHSLLHLFGFRECSNFSVDDSSQCLCVQSESDGKELLTVWTDLGQAEVRSRSLRPVVRGLMTHTLSQTFIEGDDIVRGQWERDYPKQILACIFDLSHLVRLVGTIGVTGSLAVMSNQHKVIESTLRNLPPVSNDDTEFKKWYKSLNKEVGVPVRQAWEDARTSVEFVSVLSMALLGGSTSDEMQKESILFNIVVIAHERIDLEPVCFLLVDHFASIAGFQKAENMVLEYQDSLVKRWLKYSKDESLVGLPLLLSAPCILRFLIQCSFFSSTKHDGSSFDRIREHSGKEFFVRNARLVLPYLLSTLNGPTLTPGPHLIEFCSLYGHDDPNEVMGKLVKSHLPSLAACCAVFRCISSRFEKLSSRISKVIEHYGGKDSHGALKKRHLSSTAKYFVEQASSVCNEKENTNFHVRIANEFEQLSGNDVTADLFLRAGCTLSECCIWSRLWTRSSKDEWAKHKRIQALHVLWNIALRSAEVSGSDLQLDFLFLLFSELFADHNHGSLKLLFAALTLLESILQQLTKPDAPTLLRDECFKMELRVLFCSVWHFHEHQQVALTRSSSKSNKIREVFRKRTRGLALESTEREQEGSRLPETSSEDICELLGISRKVLHLVTENSATFGLRYPSDFRMIFISSKISSEDKADLMDLGRGHTTLLDFDDGGMRRFGSAPPGLYHRLISDKPVLVGGCDRSGNLSPHQLLLVAELKDLYQFLSAYGSTHIANDRALVLQRLAQMCLNSPSVIRGAASRCIGALQCAELDNPNNALHIPALPSDGRLKSVLEERCLELLMDLAKSARVYSATIAMETTKTLLLTESGRGATPLKQLSHFTPSTQIHELSLVLAPSEVKRIKADFVNNETWVEWCWDEAYWVSCLESDFDGWICKLVPAILICHYGEPKKRIAEKESGGFLSCSQRISYLEPNYAVLLFPLLILDLLQSKEHINGSTAFSGVQIDTWIGDPGSPITQKISKCFAAVLHKCKVVSRVKDSRAIGLLVDTLDMTRRLQHHQFMISNEHVRNPSNLKAFLGLGTLSSDTPPQDTPPASQSQDYPLQNMDAVKRRGIPVGVGLCVDGMDLAEACLKIRRYSSAVFYAEQYAEVRFGGSTHELSWVIEATQKDPNLNEHMTNDISGYPVQTPPSNGPNSIIEEAEHYFKVLAESSQALNEMDHLRALLSKKSDIVLMGKKSTAQSHGWMHHSSPVETMRLVDNHMTSRRIDDENQIALQCLSDLHLYGTLQTSIEGLAGRDCTNDECDKTLRDKWYEGCLFGNSLASLTERPYDINHLLPSSDQSSGFCESVLSGLLSLYSDDKEICSIHIENARQTTFETMSDFVATEASSVASLDLIDKLNCLNDLESVIARHRIAQDEVLGNWKAGKMISNSILERSHCTPFQRQERRFSDRIQELVLQHLSSQPSEMGSTATHLLSSLLWQSATSCFANESIGDAQKAFQKLSSIHGNDSTLPDFFRVRHLEARILEKRGDFSNAIRHVSQSLSRLHLYPLVRGHDDTQADLLLCCGRWMARHRVDSGEHVLGKFLRPGLELARKIHIETPTAEAAWRLTEACITLGDLVFNIYETITARVKSQEWKQAGASLKAREQELQEYNNMAKKSQDKKKVSAQDWEQWLKDLLIFKQNLSRDVQQLRSERAKIERSIAEYKELVLRTLVEALSAADDTYNLMSKYVYRLVSIWFMPSSRMEDPAAFDSIPSYRFVPLANQLFSRLSPSNSSLKRLTGRLCSDHPYHCLPQMVRLEVGKSSMNERDRIKASVAGVILEITKSDSPDFLTPLIENYEILLESYVYLAESNTDEFVRGKTKKINFSAVYKGKVVRLDNCIGKGSRQRPCPPCVLTKPPPLRPNCDYGGGLDDPIGGERIRKFDQYFTIAESGITRPKIVLCEGSKGGRFKQLVKGGDDCRSDAVMQQVFAYVNELFAQQKAGRDKQMRIVTYTILPTSPTTGVLEWVEETLPFGDYLTDRGRKGIHVGAHSRYYPGEWGAVLCREYLKNAPREHKREAFETICKFHTPAFRFFFVERFGHSAHDWFEAKSRYTRSVAVSSFVGHILGIGDRHSNNILVHQKTGEVVHIDFGIVFEQGKLLQVPERVPFRLTRNVVDAFGPTGTEGRFTTTSRETMKALRQNGEALLTILSAITTDPLYRWTLNPKLQRKRQELLGNTSGRVSNSGNFEETRRKNNEVSEKNETASQAVRKVKEKLSGYEDGTAGEQQSVEGQVHFLINSARDTESLSQMYHGWAPWS